MCIKNYHQTISFINRSNILMKPDTLVGSSVVEVVAVVEVLVMAIVAVVVEVKVV